MKATSTTSRDSFEEWLFYMDDAIDRFLQNLPDDTRAKLDYSIGSMDTLEDWMLRRYPSPEAALAPEEKEYIDGAARYVGETIRKMANAIWSIELKNKRDAYFQLPIIVPRAGKGVLCCPHTTVSACLDRRQPGWLRGVVEFAAS